MTLSRTDRRLRTAAIVLTLGWFAIGCGPANLAMLLIPFVDDKVPAKCKLADDDKEIKVVIASRFETLEVRPEVQPADQELAELLSQDLRRRFKENKEKVKIEPPLRVRPHLSKLKEWDTPELIGLGEKFQADYVIVLNIQNMSLMLPKSYNAIYRGEIDLNLTVIDVREPAVDAVRLTQHFRSQYPNVKIINTDDMNMTQFRALFISRIARDMARLFTAYPSDERFDID